MGLPVLPLPTGAVDIGGTSVPIRSLSRREAITLNGYRGREDEAEDFILACGTDASVEEAHRWRETVDVETAGLLIDAIIDLSKLGKNGKSPNRKPS